MCELYRVYLHVGRDVILLLVRETIIGALKRPLQHN